jgi:hypothetical protein
MAHTSRLQEGIHSGDGGSGGGNSADRFLLGGYGVVRWEEVSKATPQAQKDESVTLTTTRTRHWAA